MPPGCRTSSSVSAFVAPFTKTHLLYMSSTCISPSCLIPQFTHPCSSLLDLKTTFTALQLFPFSDKSLTLSSS